MQITKSEINSILFYQGSAGQIELEESEKYLRGFYRAYNAYEGINVLLFEGFENEKARIIHEGRELDTILLDFFPELLKVYCDIYRAMCKYVFLHKTEKLLYTYRTDRIQTLSHLEQGQLPSFFSTASIPLMSPYFQKKKGILLLLEIEAASDVPHLDFNEVLEEKSAFSNEKEILFPPFLNIYKKKLELNEREKTYTDIDGNPPKAKYKLYITGREPAAISGFEERDRLNEKNMQCFLERIMQEKDIDTAKNVWTICNMGSYPKDTDIKQYVSWKKKIQTYLKIEYSNIYKTYKVNQGEND